MSDSLDSTGIQVKTYTELLSDAKTAWQSIYGADINVGSNSPDGQQLNFIAQIGTDLRELIVNVYNSFSRDKASGIPLDERASMVDKVRKGATFTITPIDVTVNTLTVLQGLDADLENINGTGFTVSDDTGNNFILTATTTLNAGTTSLPFRAAAIGAVETTLNTITNINTFTLGGVTVNNSQAATILGEDEESDFEFKLRMAHSPSSSSIAQVDALYTALYNLDGVVYVNIHENLTDSSDAYGTPPNGIWVIVEGGSTLDIATAIYNNLNCCNMKGSTTYTIATTSGQPFLVKYDVPTLEPLYIKYSLQPTTTGITYDTNSINTYIAQNLSYMINEYADTSKITPIITAGIASSTGNAVAVEVKVSNNGSTWVDYLSTTSLNYKWSVSASNIIATVIT